MQPDVLTLMASSPSPTSLTSAWTTWLAAPTTGNGGKLPLAGVGKLCYNNLGESQPIMYSIFPPQKAALRKRLELSGGPLFAMTCLLFPAVPFKPLAYTVGDYVRCDGHDETDEPVHKPTSSRCRCRWGQHVNYITIRHSRQAIKKKSAKDGQSRKNRYNIA